MELVMKRSASAILFFAAFSNTRGCNHHPSAPAPTRPAILNHLTAVGTLNIRAMQMDIHSVSIKGNQAHAEVEFRPKTGAAPGAGMQISYNLEKRDGSWVVLKTKAAGGTIQHPDPNQNPHQNENVHSGSLPNFSHVLNPSAALDTASARKPR